MRYWHKYLIYLSIIFLVYVLYNANYLKIPRIDSYPSLIASFAFLFAGFVSSVIAWRRLLVVSKLNLSLDSCTASIGLSIFAKYIPGKIWIIMGRAGYLSEHSPYSLEQLSWVSLKAQFISLWTGLICGVMGVFTVGGLRLWGWLVLALWIILTIAVFSKFAHEKIKYLFKILSRKNVLIPMLTTKSTLAAMPWFVVYWALWATGFYMLCLGLSPENVNWTVAFGFPLAGSLGILTPFSPGGLGTREGVMAGYLSLAGVPILEATTIAVAARLWFLLGEAFMFIVGWICHKMVK